MADIAEAPNQEAIADSLVGVEEQEQPVEQQPGEEQQEVQELQEQPVEQEQEQEQQVEEEQEWLPSDQDRTFPDEVLARYCQRYGIDQVALTNPQLRQLVVDKINSDIFIQQQREQQEQYEPEPEPEPTQSEPQVTREQYFQNLDRVVAERTDPQVAKQFHADFLKAFGVPDSEIAKASPQQAMAFTHTASKYMLNLMNTFMGDMLGAQLQQQISQAFPGFGDMYERSSMAMAWDRVRNSDPKFGNLPAYGTKQFSQTLRQAASQIPGFDEMQFTDQNGNALPPQANAMRKYEMLAKIASGQSVNPQLLQQAAAAGARNAKRADIRRANGNLGSGQSKSAGGATRTSSKFQTNDDLFDEATMEIYKREHGRI